MSPSRPGYDSDMITTGATAVTPTPPEPVARLALDPSLPPWAALNAAFAGVIAYATAQVPRAEQDPAKAIHEYRKSIRRARALVRLVRPFVKGKQYERLDGELR